MTAFDLLEEARRRGVELRAEGEELRFRAPVGALDADLKEELRARKAELLKPLRRGRGDRYRALALSDLTERLAGAWRWIHDQRPDLFDAINRTDEIGDVETLERLMAEGVAAFEAATRIPTIPRLADGSTGAVSFVHDNGDVTLERLIWGRL